MKVADHTEIFVIWRKARNHGHVKGVPCQHSPPRLLYRDQEIFTKENYGTQSLEPPIPKGYLFKTRRSILSLQQVHYFHSIQSKLVKYSRSD